MPELPDVTVYIESLDSRLRGQVLEKIRLASPFLLRSYDPPLSSAFGRHVEGFLRLGKRIVFVLEGELFLVLHLMIAGRLRWRDPGAGIPGRIGLAAFDFPAGSLLLTEAGTRRRAALHVVSGREGLGAHDPGGLEVLECTLEDFAGALRRETHTLKRALTDPRNFSGIGNAYSDEILHAARLSPLRRTDQLETAEVERLFEATRSTLSVWLATLRLEAEAGFPERVTAFREGMAVHGRYRLPCPVCATLVQRIRYADNETDYCPACQTGGKVLADRSLSRLLRDDWPRTLEELEALRRLPKP